MFVLGTMLPGWVSGVCIGNHDCQDGLVMFVLGTMIAMLG